MEMCLALRKKALRPPRRAQGAAFTLPTSTRPRRSRRFPGRIVHAQFPLLKKAITLFHRMRRGWKCEKPAGIPAGFLNGAKRALRSGAGT